MRTSQTTFTLLRIDKQNRRWISAIGLPTLVSRLAAHAGNPRIEQLRASVQGRSAKELDPAICRKLIHYHLHLLVIQLVSSFH